MFKPVQLKPRQFEITVYKVEESLLLTVVDSYNCSIYDFDRCMLSVIRKYPYGQYLINVQEHMHWENEYE